MSRLWWTILLVVLVTAMISDPQRIRDDLLIRPDKFGAERL